MFSKTVSWTGAVAACWTSACLTGLAAGPRTSRGRGLSRGRIGRLGGFRLGRFRSPCRLGLDNRFLALHCLFVSATASQKNRQAERCQHYHCPSFHSNSPYVWFIAASCPIDPMQSKLYNRRIDLQSQFRNNLIPPGANRLPLPRWIFNDLSAGRPDRLGRVPFSLADPDLAAAVGPHDIDRSRAAPFRAERYETPIRRPGRGNLDSRVEGQTLGVAPVPGNVGCSPAPSLIHPPSTA